MYISNYTSSISPENPFSVRLFLIVLFSESQPLQVFLTFVNLVFSFKSKRFILTTLPLIVKFWDFNLFYKVGRWITLSYYIKCSELFGFNFFTAYYVHIILKKRKYFLSSLLPCSAGALDLHNFKYLVYQTPRCNDHW